MTMNLVEQQKQHRRLYRHWWQHSRRHPKEDHRYSMEGTGEDAMSSS